MKEWIIFTDGGARGNPGPAASAFLVFSLNGEKIFSSAKFLGETTNNVAEYQGVIMALNWITAQSLDEETTCSFYLDSQLVVQQLSGRYRVKDEKLQRLVMTAKDLEKKFTGRVVYYYLPREFNRMADWLVNQKLDQK